MALTGRAAPAAGVPPELQRELDRVYSRAIQLRRSRRRVAPASCVVIFAAAVLAVVLLRPLGPVTPAPSASSYPADLLALRPATTSAGADSGQGLLDSYVVLVSSTTGNVVRVLTGEIPATVDDLALSPDGRTAYYVLGGQADGAIEEVSTAGGPSREVAQGFDPVVSPDGRYLAFVSPSDDLVVLDLTTGEQRVLGQTVVIVPPVWAGDSYQLAMVVSALCAPGHTCPHGTAFTVYDLRPGASTTHPAAGGVIDTTSTALTIASGPRPGTISATFPAVGSGQPRSMLEVVDADRPGSAAVVLTTLAGAYPAHAGPTYPGLVSVSASGRYALVSGVSGSGNGYAVIDLLSGRQVGTVPDPSASYPFSEPVW
jgi:hypothetical protein